MMNAEERMEALEDRFAALERETQRVGSRLGRLAAFLGVAAGAALLTGAGPVNMPEALRARSLTLVDAQGRERIVLAAPDEGPSLRVRDEAGRDRIVAELVKDEAAFRLRDAAGRDRAVLVARAQGAEAALLDEAGRSRASLGTYGKETALRLRDEAGRLRAEMAAPGEGNPKMALYGQDGKPVFAAP